MASDQSARNNGGNSGAHDPNPTPSPKSLTIKCRKARLNAMFTKNIYVLANLLDTVAGCPETWRLILRSDAIKASNCWPTFIEMCMLMPCLIVPNNGCDANNLHSIKRWNGFVCSLWTIFGQWGGNSRIGIVLISIRASVFQCVVCVLPSVHQKRDGHRLAAKPLPHQLLSLLFSRTQESHRH